MVSVSGQCPPCFSVQGTLGEHHCSDQPQEVLLPAALPLAGCARQPLPLMVGGLGCHCLAHLIWFKVPGAERRLSECMLCSLFLGFTQAQPKNSLLRKG